MMSADDVSTSSKEIGTPAPLRVVRVYNSEQLHAALADASAGDEIVLTSARTYDRVEGFHLAHSGTAKNPIVIKGAGDPARYREAPKLVSPLEIRGSYVRMHNLYFENCQVLLDGAEHVVFYRSWFRHYNHHTLQLIHGAHYGRVEYCYFEGPEVNDTTNLRMINASSKGISSDWLIRRCHFKNIPRSLVPGQSRQGNAVRIGEGYLSGGWDYRWTVEYCLFEDIQVDEIISNKSSENTIRFCTFINSNRLLLRYGKRNKVHGVWFENSVGLTVRDEDNEIVGIKLIDGLLQIMSGSVEAADSPVMGKNKRPNAERTLVAGYDGDRPIEVGADLYGFAHPARDSVLEGVRDEQITYGPVQVGTINPPAPPERVVYTPFKLTARDVGPGFV